ncbi:cytochrome P450 monooxygenase 13 [Heterobasidion irregulare TC 32-1]|uniref:Cytochrome P450 monooxygenase 13 n=1 Tax=Heterobasidion irregulare (strain TC 32-1) TaxID=747525 RepID=W4JX00_HETIT|nr:cytochrome P450 monooxygenase 13 [Heterobasidion irregulare TC 32-1]ETW77984.1 cytochrome P450 monooxygenase 13 [Heterobasidion irregulare TC 32-1]
MGTLIFFGLCIALLYALQALFEYRKAVRNLGGHPGVHTLVSPASVFGQILPRIRGLSVGRSRSWKSKFQDFQEAGWDAFTQISVWPRPSSHLFLADAAAIKEVTTYRARFPKPVEQYKVLQFFGRNIVASEGEEWKRYRKIVAPAFSERNNKLVWDETIRIMIDMFDNVWHNAPEISTDHCIELTVPIALFVIGVAGFGRRISWTDDMKLPPGHQLTFKDALHTMSTDIFLKLIVPGWAMGLTKHLRHVRQAFKEMDQYMMEMIRERRNSEKKEERYDLFSSLLDASDDTSDGEVALADSELVGNIFIFLVAGHETTAHTLCFTFALLALYPDEQDRLYKSIKSVMSDLDRLPNYQSYEEMPLLTYSMAVFYETLRMFPPVNGIPKYSAEDTSLVVGNANGDRTTIPVPQNTNIVIHTPGLHYNPRYWDDPHTFKPERFLGDWPRDAFLPFSQGARACLGRRFFETEGIAILTMLMSRYKVTIKEEPEYAHETFEERKARILNAKPGLTLTPIRVPLVFTKRD